MSGIMIRRLCEDTDRLIEEKVKEDRGTHWSNIAASQGLLASSRNQREARKDFPSEPPGGSQPCLHLNFRLLAS